MTFEMRTTLTIKPKERPRMGKGGHFYTPRATQSCEAQLKQEAWIEACKIGLKGPTKDAVEIFVWTPRKQRGDIDNVLKTILDALQGVVYGNDSQVVRASISREPMDDTRILIKSVFRAEV
jgi:Holliday junction resolvase RusA-like endonuclease